MNPMYDSPSPTALICLFFQRGIHYSSPSIPSHPKLLISPRPFLLGRRDHQTCVITDLSSSINSQGLKGFPGGSEVKAVCQQCRRPGFNPWVRKIPWRRKWQLSMWYWMKRSRVLIPFKYHYKKQKTKDTWKRWQQYKAQSQETQYKSSKITHRSPITDNINYGKVPSISKVSELLLIPWRKTYFQQSMWEPTLYQELFQVLGIQGWLKHTPFPPIEDIT